MAARLQVLVARNWRRGAVHHQRRAATGREGIIEALLFSRAPQLPAAKADQQSEHEERHQCQPQ